jgi:hypothetical protein
MCTEAISPRGQYSYENWKPEVTNIKRTSFENTCRASCGQRISSKARFQKVQVKGNNWREIAAPPMAAVDPELAVATRSQERQQLPFLIQPPTRGDFSKADIRTGFQHQLKG